MTSDERLITIKSHIIMYTFFFFLNFDLEIGLQPHSWQEPIMASVSTWYRSLQGMRDMKTVICTTRNAVLISKCCYYNTVCTAQQNLNWKVTCKFYSEKFHSAVITTLHKGSPCAYSSPPPAKKSCTDNGYMTHNTHCIKISSFNFQKFFSSEDGHSMVLWHIYIYQIMLG